MTDGIVFFLRALFEHILFSIESSIFILLLREVKRKKTFDMIIVYAMYSGK